MFKIIHKSKISKARLGIIQTPHGNLETPIFMPDATRGVIKHLSSRDLDNLGLGCLVANTLHLYLRPGDKLIKQAKGLHNFMNWQKPILTDSGGYQIFSLIYKSESKGAINNQGAIFNSPINGAKIKITPELSIKMQFALGADLMVCFDDCPPNLYKAADLSASVERTIKWAKRCKIEFAKQIKSHKNKRPLLFAVIQGGNNLRLRERCSGELIKIGFDGFGFGARHLDESGNFLNDALKFTADQIPENKLRFGLGIGRPEDIVRSIRMGWDMFDCVIPTREGRHGKLFMRKNKSDFIKNGKIIYHTINITNAKFSKDFSPINPSSRLEELRRYSKAYLNYLFKISEPLALRLSSLNNLEFYINIISEAKKQIKNNKI